MPVFCSIDDDAWADKADPVTGSVFYIEPSVPAGSGSCIVPSSSSSSLSSSPPVSEHFDPSSPTTYTSLPERYGLKIITMAVGVMAGRHRFAASVQLPLAQSPLEEQESLALSKSFRWDKPPSLRRKLKKMVGMKKHGKKHSVLSESLSGEKDLAHST